MAERDLGPIVREGLARRAHRFHPRGGVQDVLARARRRERARRTGTAVLALGLFAAAALLLVPRLLWSLDDGRPAAEPGVAAWIPVGGDLYSPVFGSGKVWVYSGRRGLFGIDAARNEVAVGLTAAVPPLAVDDDLWAVGGGLQYGRVSVILRIDPHDGTLKEVIDLPRPVDVPEPPGSFETAVASVVHEGEVLVAVGGATVVHIDVDTSDVVRTDVLAGDYGAILDMAVAGDVLWTLRERAVERTAGLDHSVLLLSERVPRAMTASPETAWILLESGEILRREAAGGAESFRPELEGDVSDLTYGDGRLWVVSTRDGGEVVVRALDPETGDLLGEVSLGAPAPGLPEASTSPSLVAAAGSVWATEPTRGILVRIDPEGRSSFPIPGPTPSDASAGTWGRSFTSTRVTERGLPKPLVRDTQLELTFDHGAVRFRAGCNRFATAVFASTPDRLLVGEIGGTQVGCDTELLEQDRWLVEFFMADPYWEFQDGRLRLAVGETVIELEAVD